MQTTITVSTQTKKRIAKHGYFNESYDVVINRLIDAFELDKHMED